MFTLHIRTMVRRSQDGARQLWTKSQTPQKGQNEFNISTFDEYYYFITKKKNLYQG